MKTVVLLGGGHSHLHILKQLQKEQPAGTRWILVSSSRYHYYSGMFSGFAEGLYRENETRIDLRSLTKDIHFIEKTVVSIDATNKKITFADDSSVTYDLLSVDVGSLTSSSAIPGLDRYQQAMKPAHSFSGRLSALRQAKRLVIIGGGAAACEMACSLAAWKQQHAPDTKTTVISGGKLLSAHPAKAREQMLASFHQYAIDVHEHARVSHISESFIEVEPNVSIPYDEVMFLGGPQANPLLKNSGLTVNENGFLLVNATLQSVHDPAIFAAGDCATLVTHPDLPKSGVFAVRQGPVLWHNLLAVLSRTPLKDFAPQKRTLALLSTGEKEALLLYGRFVRHGAAYWHIKNRIDRRFVGRLEC